MKAGETPERRATGSLALSAAAMLAVGVVGIALVAGLGATMGMSRYVYLTVDAPGLVAVAIGFSAALAFAGFRKPLDGLMRARPAHVAVAAFAVFVASAHVVHHGFAFSMDEWTMRWQAEVFSEGRLTGAIAPEWREYGRALYHGFIAVDPSTGAAASIYRPGMAALIALFDLFDASLYLSALFSAGAALVAALIARLIWPDAAGAPLVAALTIATSSQVFAAAGTSYAMAGHMFFNLLWLRLFLAHSRAANLAAPLIGVAAASLHQIHVHLFFAAPFYLLLLRPMRLGLLAWCAAVYAIGHLWLIGWSGLQATGGGAGGGESLLETALRIVRLPDGFEIATVLANVARFASWQSLALPVLLLGLIRFGAGSKMVRLLLASLVVGLFPYPFLMPDQGHGWGYRYMHGHIGALALLAAAGWAALEREGRVGVMRAAAAAFVASAVVVVPARAVRMESVVSKWKRGADAIATGESDAIVVDSVKIFYGQDIARSDPFARNRPLHVHLHRIALEDLATLCATRRVGFFGVDEAERMGLPVRDFAPDALPDDYQAKIALLESEACAP